MIENLYLDFWLSTIYIEWYTISCDVSTQKINTRFKKIGKYNENLPHSQQCIELQTIQVKIYLIIIIKKKFPMQYMYFHSNPANKRSLVVYCQHNWMNLGLLFGKRYFYNLYSRPQISVAQNSLSSGLVFDV